MIKKVKKSFSKKFRLLNQFRDLTLKRKKEYEKLLDIALEVTSFNKVFFVINSHDEASLKLCHKITEQQANQFMKKIEHSGFHCAHVGGSTVAYIPIHLESIGSAGYLCFIKEEVTDEAFEKKIKETLINITSVASSMIETDIEVIELNKLKKQYEAVQSMSMTGGWELDLKTNKTIWSKEVYKIHALDSDIALDKVDAISFYAEHERERIDLHIENCIVHQIPYDDEFEFIDAKGAHKWVRAIGRPIVDDDGEIRKLVGTFQDVTQQKEYELSLLEKHLEINDMNSYLDLALTGGELGIWDWNLKTDEVEFDERWLSMLGLSKENSEMSLSTWEDRVHPNDIQKCYEDIKNYLDGKTSSYENVHRMKHADGHWVYILDKGRISDWDNEGKPIRFTGTHLDVTESRQREQELNIVLREAGIGIWKFYPQTQELIWDESMYTLFGVDKNDFSGAYDAWEKTLAEEDKKRAVKDLESALAGNGNFESTFSIVTSSGKRKVIGARADIERDPDGNAIAMIGINWDITKEHESALKLKEQAAFMQKTLDSIPVVFHLKDLAGKYLMVNNAFLKLYNMSESEVLGKKDHDIFDHNIALVHKEGDEAIIRNAEVYESDYEIGDIEEQKRKFHSIKFPYLNNNGQVYAIGGISIDFTEKDAMEKAFNHNVKLASIGELAAGVGHEINNPLTIIKGYASTLMKRSHEFDENVVMNLCKISNAAERIENIVSGLRTFSRIEDDAEKLFNVRETLLDLKGMVHEIFLQEGVIIEFNFNDIDDDLCMKGARGKLEQVLINLLANAKDASEGREKRYIKLTAKHSNRALEITIEDNGRGLSEKDRDKIFDPFYTTKTTGQGTGIGLSLVHKFVYNDFKGTIDVDSTVNQGTIFKLSLPCDIVVIEKEAHAVDFSDKSKVTASYNIVIVDDEEGIREYLNDMVSDLGHNVLTFENGKAALEYYVDNAHKIDLIISDMKMAEMDGPTLLNEIRNCHGLNQPKFIFITGGINIDLDDKNNTSVKLSDGFLYKPFCEIDIIDKIDELLNHKKKAA